MWSNVADYSENKLAREPSSAGHRHAAALAFCNVTELHGKPAATAAFLGESTQWDRRHGGRSHGAQLGGHNQQHNQEATGFSVNNKLQCPAEFSVSPNPPGRRDTKATLS